MSSSSDKILAGSIEINGRTLRRTERRVNNAAVSRRSLKCVICLESYVSNRPAATRCGHIFCRVCIEQVAWYHQPCPTCRCPVESCHLFDLEIV